MTIYRNKAVAVGVLKAEGFMVVSDKGAIVSLTKGDQEKIVVNEYGPNKEAHVYVKTDSPVLENMYQ